MKMWRRLVRWLAQKELSELTSTYTEAIAQHTAMAERAAAVIQKNSALTSSFIQQLHAQKMQAYAEGQCSGREEMHNRILTVVAERGWDNVNQEDVALAKKGLVH